MSSTTTWSHPHRSRRCPDRQSRAVMAAGTCRHGGLALKATRRQLTPLSSRFASADFRAVEYLAIGFNYTSHLARYQAEPDAAPVRRQMERFLHLPRAFADPNAAHLLQQAVFRHHRPYEPDSSRRTTRRLRDFEGELVAVSEAVRRADAPRARVPRRLHGGQTTCRYVTGRQDTPRVAGQELRQPLGPIGPWIVTADDLVPRVWGIRSVVDGELTAPVRAHEGDGPGESAT